MSVSQKGPGGVFGGEALVCGELSGCAPVGESKRGRAPGLGQIRSCRSGQGAVSAHQPVKVVLEASTPGLPRVATRNLLKLDVHSRGFGGGVYGDSLRTVKGVIGTYGDFAGRTREAACFQHVDGVLAGEGGIIAVKVFCTKALLPPLIVGWSSPEISRKVGY